MAKVYDTATDMITFARLQAQNTTSGSSYLGSDGLLKFAAEDEPRIEYAADGSLKGLLIEEQRTNLVQYSEDFSNAEWTITQSGLASISVSSEKTPDGLTNAYEITEDNTATVHYFQDGISGLSATSYTLSVFARQGSGTRYLQLRTGGAGIFANFDLSAGNVVDSGGAYILQANIEDFGNNWYRCSVAGDFAVAPSSYQIILSNSTGGAPSYTGDGTSSILVYGAQLEQGSFATSYIPTSGSQSTRSPDIASIPVSSFGYNQSAGTVVVEFSKMYPDAGNNRFHAGFGADGSNYVGVGYAAIQRAYVQPLVGAIDVSGASAPTPGEFATVAAGFDASGATSAVDGQSNSATATGAAPALSQSDTLYLGSSPYSPSEIASGHIKSLSYFPRRLTNAQLQELTA